MGRLCTLLRRGKMAALAVVTIGSLLLAGYWLLGERTAKPPARAHARILLPGFAALPLPVALPNVNCVRYHADGRLFAGTFSGKIYTLSDRDGDGLEETVATFWDDSSLKTITGMALTPPGSPHGEGVFVATMGKIVLVLDADRDGRGDKQVVVTKPWEAPRIAGGGCVDAVGLAVDRDGAVFFGLGTSDFQNPYLLADGRAHYTLHGERGTVQRLSPDLKSRATFATGLRFTVGMNINRHGDLFCTDQEGATWIANGNAFDELLHLQSDRHYGFPPRHPDHLPGVIDEPSTFDYGPQHQCTCGFCFNDASPTAQPCGPPSWQGNAIVTGESRGKLFRTSLVKTPNGYVARNQVLACLAALPVDVCVSPAGELVVACHGGDPDWGSGPAGIGALVKIRYVDRHTPQPVVAWRESPTEVRVAFDRPLEREEIARVMQGVEIETGPYVRAGDRFEAFRPGYAIVEQQTQAPRVAVPALSASLSDDNRMLSILTSPQTTAWPGAISLPTPTSNIDSSASLAPTMHLDLDANGCQAEWKSVDGATIRRSWLPHVDLQVARELTAGSASHEQFLAAIAASGQLTIRGQLDLWQMLRPPLQQDSKPDYALPQEQVSLHGRSSQPFEIAVGGMTQSAKKDADGAYVVTLQLAPYDVIWLPFTVRVQTSDAAPELSLAFSTQEDARRRPVPLHRLHVPWADQPTAALLAQSRALPKEIETGDPAVGRKLFFSQAARCSECHAIRGRGGAVGPDLSNLVQRDYNSVLRDIEKPSATINPDYTTHTIVLDSGRVLTGIVRATADGWKVTDVKGLTTKLVRDDVTEMKPSTISMMPTDLAKHLRPGEMKHLMSFLLLGEQPLTASRTGVQR